MMRTSLARAALAAVLAAVSANALRGQCDLEWVASGGWSGASGIVRATTLWDPDGAGPLPEHLVVGGEFNFVASTVSPLVAMVDPQTGVWQPLDGGMTGYRVSELVVLSNGDLIASGNIAPTGGGSSLDIARWNGSGWTSLGLGNEAGAMLPLPNGDLLVASNTLQSSQWVASLQRWNGSNWTQVGTDIGGRIEALARMPSGDIAVGGQFTSTGAQASSNLASWNGSSWASLGGDANSVVLSLTVAPGGDLFAGGYFTEIGGQPADRIARWDGVAWSPLASGVAAPSWTSVWSLAVHGNGDLLAGGTFVQAGGAVANNVARWSNGAWSSLGAGVDGQVQVVQELANGDIVVGGAFLNASGVPARRLARWNGAAWSAFGTPSVADNPITVSATTANGDLLVGGEFTTIGGVAANRVARRSNGTWAALGGGIGGGTASPVRAMIELPNGDIVVGGSFSSAGGVPVANIARWDGTAWSPLGFGTNGTVTALQLLPGGDLVAGGWFTQAGIQPASYVARWDGVAWSAIGAGAGEPVVRMAVRHNGEIVVATSFSIFTSNVRVWNGGGWQLIAAMPNGNVAAMLVTPDDEVWVGGFLGGLGSPGLSRWNGTSWLGTGLTYGASVSSLALSPDGDVIAAGNILSNAFNAPLARWDGASWTALAVESDLQLITMASLPSGELVVGGTFSTIDGIVSPYLVSIVAPCPATAATFGPGCVGSNGLNELVMDTLPWLGSTWRSRATGMPDTSLVATVTGFATIALPLTALWPQAGPACLGYTTPDHIELGLPVAGEVTSQIAVPANPVLIGASLNQYALAFEFDPQGALIAVTSTNGVGVTLGRF